MQMDQVAMKMGQIIAYKAQLKRKGPGGASSFAMLPVGLVLVSVQASEGHYCSPRVTYPDAWPYTKFEVAVFLGDSRLSPDDMGLPQNHPARLDWSPPEEVFAYMDCEVVGQLIASLEAI